jgi:23S rRNA A1618 N6-methylase RlmF
VAVRVLNRAILRADYSLKVDHVPLQHMFPSVPNRAAYLAKLSERLSQVFSHGFSGKVLVVDM